MKREQENEMENASESSAESNGSPALDITILKFRAPIFKGLAHIGGKHESKDRNGLPFAGKHTPGGPNND